MNATTDTTIVANTRNNDVYCVAVAIMNAHEDRVSVTHTTVLHLQRAIMLLRTKGVREGSEGRHDAANRLHGDAEALDARVRAFALQAIAAGARNPHLIAQVALGS